MKAIYKLSKRTQITFVNKSITDYEKDSPGTEYKSSYHNFGLHLGLSLQLYNIECGKMVISI